MSRMVGKFTVEVMRKEIEKLGCELVEGYIDGNNKKTVVVKCLCGHLRKGDYYNFLYSSHFCKSCSFANQYGLAKDHLMNMGELLKSLGYFLLDEDHIFKNVDEKISLSDLNGYKYFLSYSYVQKNNKRNSKTAIVDKSNPYNIENLILWIKNNNKPYKFLNGKFVDSIEKSIVLKCDICDSTWNTSWSYMQAGTGCSYCAHVVSPHHSNVLKEKSFGFLYPEIALDWDYEKNDKTPFDCYPKSNLSYYWKCHICGYEWTSKLYNRTKKKKSSINCPNCFISNQLKESGILGELYPELMKEWDFEKNIGIDPYRLTPGSNRRAFWICSKCGNRWNSVIETRTMGRGCSHCASSEGEKIVKNFLSEHMISFNPQYSFPDCKRSNSLQFDFGIFYLDKLWMCEVQGEQHYFPVDFGGKGKEWAEDQFKELQIRDGIKEQYCLSHNIPLLKIPYWDFDKIPEILTSYLHI